MVKNTTFWICVYGHIVIVSKKNAILVVIGAFGFFVHYIVALEFSIEFSECVFESGSQIGAKNKLQGEMVRF